VILVFDFRLGEGGFKGDRPVDGFLAAVDETLFDERSERPEDVGLEAGTLGLVLVRPVGEDAEAFELRRLFRNPLSEKSSQSFRSSAVETVRFFSWSSRETFCSIGSPWQSQPGTYGVR